MDAATAKRKARTATAPKSDKTKANYYITTELATAIAVRAATQRVSPCVVAEEAFSEYLKRINGEVPR